MSAKMISGAIYTALFCAAIAALGFTSAESAQMKKAKSLFESKKFDEALSIYENMARANPESPAANFNVGAALYSKKEFIKAIESLQKALATEERAIERDALSFIGNSYFNLAEEAEKINETLAAKSFREATNYYKRAMEIDNSDKAVRYNHELAKKRLYYLAEGADGPKKEMLRKSVGALEEESRALALARKKDIERREEDNKITHDRREEDRRKREERRQEDRAIDEARRREDDAPGAQAAVEALPTAGSVEATPVTTAAPSETDIAAREEARRREDAGREEARRKEDAQTEARRRREDAEREDKRLREGTMDKMMTSRAPLKGPYYWLDRLLGSGTAWAEDIAPAAEGIEVKPAEKVAPIEGATPSTASGLYAKRRTEDLEREAARRAEDDEVDRHRRLEDASDSSKRRIEDASLPPEKRGDPELSKDREKEDLEKELKRLKEDRIIVVKRNKEDIAIMTERAKADAEAEKARKDSLERKAAASDDGAGELKAMAQDAAQQAASLEEAAARGQQMMSQIESTEAARSAEDAAGASGGGASGGGSGGGSSGGSAGMQEMINREKSRLSQDMSISGGQEISSEITGKLAKGGGDSGGGPPPKAERSALEELEDALMKKSKDDRAKGKKREDEKDTTDTIRDKDAELLLETYWMGEAPKKIIEREKSPDYGKDEKNW